MADSKRCRRKSCVWIGTKALKRQEHSTSLLHRTIVRGSHCGGQGHRREARAAPLPAWGRTSARKQWGSTHRAVLSARPPRPQPEEDQVQGWAVDTEAGQSGKSSWRRGLGGWFRKGRKPEQRGEKQATCLGSWALDDLSTTRCAGNLLSGGAPVRAEWGWGDLWAIWISSSPFCPESVSLRDERSPVGFQTSWH